MQQLTQNLKNGEMKILEVPFPALAKGQVLVKTHYSAISTGTEGKTVNDARLGYIGKAMSRQKEVKMVLESVRNIGLKPTYDAVMKKLDAPSALGYSLSGEVIAIADDVTSFQIGDHVACAGATAIHAEVINVPVNLCVKVPKSVDLKYAAFSTIASIAMQGIRQADLRLGENCVVIGLGLIGQLTVQMLNAAGINAIGIDIDKKAVDLASKGGAVVSMVRDEPGLEDIILNHTDGFGADAVIITAGTSSLDPVELSGRLCRKKGKVIIVGAVPTGFSREHYYKKELELKMSSSYGPGRYDINYEEKGIDYPIGYVRWTENRNMQAYIKLLEYKKINIDLLITHQYDFENAKKAYDLILSREEYLVGVVLQYDIKKELKTHVTIPTPIHKANRVQVSFIGAGSFAQGSLLPNIKDHVALVDVSTSRGNTSINVAKKYGFQRAINDITELLNNDTTNTVFITTRHNLHAQLVIDSLKSGKNVFVEKPLAMTFSELQDIVKTYESIEEPPRLMVGYNRRFAPLIQEIKKNFSNKLPRSINYRINAGTIPANHWVQDKNIGGGRIIGEVCHFIDLAIYLVESKISTVSADIMTTAENLLDTLNINLKFNDGSIANISYFSNGNKLLNKEYLEVFSGGKVAVLDDFKKLTMYDNKVHKVKKKGQDKGHKDGVLSFIDSIKNGTKTPISMEELLESTLATLLVTESALTQNTLHVDISSLKVPENG